MTKARAAGVAVRGECRTTIDSLAIYVFLDISILCDDPVAVYTEQATKGRRAVWM